MFKKIINKLLRPNKEEKTDYSFVWYDKGPDNPFDMRFLDIRSFTTDVTSFASDQEAIDLFVKFRESDGQLLIAGPASLYSKRMRIRVCLLSCILFLGCACQ